MALVQQLLLLGVKTQNILGEFSLPRHELSGRGYCFFLCKISLLKGRCVTQLFMNFLLPTWVLLMIQIFSLTNGLIKLIYVLSCLVWGLLPDLRNKLKNE